MGEYDKAIPYFENVISASPDDEAVLYHLGISYFRTGKFPEAVEMFRKSVKLNPEDNSHEYHYGYIQLESLGQKTKVTQVAYFDFFGDFLWVNYPLYGGMSDFLKYNASGKQETILKRMHLYQPRKSQ